MDLLLEDQELFPNDDEREREKLYHTVLQNIGATLSSISNLELDTHRVTISLRSELASKQAKENELKQKFQGFQKDIITKANLSAKNETLNPKMIAEFEEDEKIKRQQINEMRLSLINTKLQLKRLERKMKSKVHSRDEEGLIAYEQLKVESQSLNAKLIHRQKEMKRLQEAIEQNTITISTINGDIEMIAKEIQDREESIQSVDRAISLSGKKLSQLIAQHKEIEKTFKTKTAAASNRVVKENYVSSIQVVKTLTATLEALKKQHRGLTSSCSHNIP